MVNLKTEMVFRGHHDKLADQLSDGVLTYYLEHNPDAIVNIDVVGSGDTIFVTGTVDKSEVLDISTPIKKILTEMKYDLSNLTIVNDVIQSSLDTSKLEKISVYGYASNETEELLPKIILINQEIAKEYNNLCKMDKGFRPDGKFIIEGLYDENCKLILIKSITINHQHDEDSNIDELREDLAFILEGVTSRYDVEVGCYRINPFGDYLEGGFERDTGISGTKLDIDSYHGIGTTTQFPVCGKDINGRRGAVFQARELAKQTLQTFGLEWCEVKVDYEEGEVIPYSISINSNIGLINLLEGEKELDNFVPEKIVSKFNLKNKNFVQLAAYGQVQ